MTFGRICAYLWAKFGRYVPDKQYLTIRYWLLYQQYLNLDSPKTFNEKINWLKIYDRNPLYTRLVDKAEVKNYVSDIIGEDHIVPTYGVWERFEDIDFDKLPNKFVLKSTNGGGSNGVILCLDKSNFNKNEAKKRLESSMKTKWKTQREWVYYNVKPRIIAEEFLTADSENTFIDDYKFFCFNGVPRAILVCKDRFMDTGVTEDFFTPEWKHLDLQRPGTPNSRSEITPPKELVEMKEIAEKLSKDIPFVRVDFYTKSHKVYFGELTFYPAGGLTPFVPSKYDNIFGGWLEIDVMGGVNSL